MQWLINYFYAIETLFSCEFLCETHFQLVSLCWQFLGEFKYFIALRVLSSLVFLQEKFLFSPLPKYFPSLCAHSIP